MDCLTVKGLKTYKTNPSGFLLNSTHKHCKCSEQIKTMYINALWGYRWVLTTDFEWSLKFKKNWLTEENLSGLDAEPPHLSLCHLYDLPWTASSHYKVKSNTHIIIVIKTEKEKHFIHITNSQNIYIKQNY